MEEETRLSLPSMKEGHAVFAFQSRTPSPGYLKNHLNDGMREGSSDRVFRRILIRVAAILAFYVSLSL